MAALGGLLRPTADRRSSPRPRALASPSLWSGVGSAIVWFIVKLVTGGRVKEEVEEEGLDLNEHGESAYHP